MKDKSNIFNLEQNKLLEYKNNEFSDCMNGAKEFADNLKYSIITKDTPYVLLLENNFGMGKTHFITRFAYYLYNIGINTIYFSVWENDYIENPFISFSSEIIKYFKQESKSNKIKNLTKAIGQLIYNIAKSTSFSSGINIMGINSNCTIDIDSFLTAFETFISNTKEKNDCIYKFKIELKKLIDTLEYKKLVIIIDELDRCRPDYAMKTLEIIKHFFDIEGLFIIVTTNEKSLQKSVKALYGIDDENNGDSECYFNKFFTERMNMFEPNYLKFVQDNIPKEKFTKLIDENKMSLDEKYNSVILLQEKLAEFGKEFKLTMREMKYALEKALYICFHIKCKIYSEYIAYMTCSKLTRNKNQKITINSEHPFSLNSKKQSLLKFKVPQEVYYLNNCFYEQQFFHSYPLFKEKQFSSYKEFYNFYNLYMVHEKDAAIHFHNSNGMNIYNSMNYNFFKLTEYINNKKQEIDKYRNTWDSDDNDEEIKKHYNLIFNRKIHIRSESKYINKD